MGATNRKPNNSWEKEKTRVQQLEIDQAPRGSRNELVNFSGRGYRLKIIRARGGIQSKGEDPRAKKVPIEAWKNLSKSQNNTSNGKKVNGREE